MSDYIPVDPQTEHELSFSRELIFKIQAEIGRHIIGQEHLRRRLITALITGGHILLEGVPGLAKTASIKALAGAVDGSFQRIQFTPDLLPSDIIGTEVYRPQDARFEIRRGPVFANFVLADEINRAPAKVQSALLEIMQEHQVTIGEQTLKVPEPFLVLATQNPIEQEGTYQLPEAQVDRFMMKVKVGYPTADQEKQVLDLCTSNSPQSNHTNKVASLEQVFRLRACAERVYVDDRLKQYIVRLVQATRAPEQFGLKLKPLIELGASPRAAISLLHAARAEAVFEKLHFCLPQMVKDVAPDILRHRVMLSYEAEAQGIDVDSIIQTILNGVEVP